MAEVYESLKCPRCKELAFEPCMYHCGHFTCLTCFNWLSLLDTVATSCILCKKTVPIHAKHAVPFMTTLCETHDPAGYEHAVKKRIAQETRLKKILQFIKSLWYDESDYKIMIDNKSILRNSKFNIQMFTPINMEVIECFSKCLMKEYNLNLFPDGVMYKELLLLDVKKALGNNCVATEITSPPKLEKGSTIITFQSADYYISMTFPSALKQLH